MSSATELRAGFPDPVGHEERIEGLWRLAEAGRLPHALLARGPRDIGKLRPLRWLALGLHCAQGPGRPCRTCGPCKRILSGNHPDHHELDVLLYRGDDESTTIQVKHIVERDGSPPTPIASFLQLRRSESLWRTVIIREVERMNINAQNAFLKTLEEPAPGTLLLLETSEPRRLLPTVLSRVMQLQLDPLSGDQVRTVLAGVELPEKVDRELLGRLASGSPGRAVELVEQGLLPARELLLGWLSGELDPSAAARELLALEGAFEGKTPAARNRARTSACLELGLDLLGDLARLQAGITPGELVHGPELEPLVGRISAQDREQWLNRWLEARKDMETNLGPEAALERALDRSPRAVQGAP